MLLPGDPSYPRGAKRAKARLNYHALKDEDTPRARAAYGRALFHNNAVPQKYSITVETIAWHREAGTNPGFMNRTQRKKRKGW